MTIKIIGDLTAAKPIIFVNIHGKDIYGNQIVAPEDMTAVKKIIICNTSGNSIY